MFGLRPQSIVSRVQASGQPPHIPSLGGSLSRGTMGFTLVSLGGFAPWMFANRAFYRAVGEIGLYGACALVFVVLSGLLLHRLIIGPGSLARFYKVFTLAFLAYAVAWTLGWMLEGGNTGSIVGLLAGTAAMGLILAQAFGAWRVAWVAIVALFVGNLAGYFAGGWVHNAILALKDQQVLGFMLERPARVLLSKASWGLCYGIGFGACLGFTFHACQAEARKLLAGLRPSAEATSNSTAALNENG
jgi:hypothetical protein